MAGRENDLLVVDHPGIVGVAIDETEAAPGVHHGLARHQAMVGAEVDDAVAHLGGVECDSRAIGLEIDDVGAGQGIGPARSQLNVGAVDHVDVVQAVGRQAIHRIGRTRHLVAHRIAIHIAVGLAQVDGVGSEIERAGHSRERCRYLQRLRLPGILPIGQILQLLLDLVTRHRILRHRVACVLRRIPDQLHFVPEGGELLKGARVGKLLGIGVHDVTARALDIDIPPGGLDTDQEQVAGIACDVDVTGGFGRQAVLGCVLPRDNRHRIRAAADDAGLRSQLNLLVLDEVRAGITVDIFLGDYVAGCHELCLIADAVTGGWGINLHNHQVAFVRDVDIARIGRIGIQDHSVSAAANGVIPADVFPGG